jgi:hypothetical protein
MLRPLPRWHLLGKLTVEKIWNKWKAGLENELSMLYGVPLVYVILENEKPEEGKVYTNSTQECLEKCKLTGQELDEDSPIANCW